MIWQPYKDKVRLIQPDNLVRLFHLDERSGSSAKDYSPNARTGTYIGPSLLDDIQPCGLNTAYWDGVNDEYVNILSNLETDFPVGNRTQGTVLMWLQTNWDEAIKKNAIHLISGTGDQIVFWVDPSGGLIHLWSYIGGVDQEITCSVSGTGWHSFVMTWATNLGGGDYVEGWCDGVSQGTDTGARSNWAGTLVRATLGIDQNLLTDEWSGHIGVTGIWDTVLSDDEIKQISRI